MQGAFPTNHPMRLVGLRSAISALSMIVKVNIKVIICFGNIQKCKLFRAFQDSYVMFEFKPFKTLIA